MSGDDGATVKVSGTGTFTVASEPADGVTVTSVTVETRQGASWSQDSETGGLNGTITFSGSAPRVIALIAETSAGNFNLIVNSL